MHLRIEKRDQLWRAFAEGVPGVEAFEPTYEAALASLLTKLSRGSSDQPVALDVFVSLPDSSDQDWATLVRSATALASDLNQNFEQAKEHAEGTELLAKAFSQLSVASEMLRHALTSESAPVSIPGPGPTFTAEEESLFSRREDEVIRGKVATRSLADVLVDHRGHG
jgi:hypothetical protein